MNRAEVAVVSVNVGQPQLIGIHRGRPVRSAIGKRPVGERWLWLDRLGLSGDGQADSKHHGGPDKAVYAYPSEHLAAWSEELGEELGPAAFGENLTTVGWLEDHVRVGDRWSWGEAMLEVSQPRAPCYKLGIHRGRPDVVRRFRDSGRTGWYLRVLRSGRVPTVGPLHVVQRHPEGVSVRAAHLAAGPGGDLERARVLLDLAPLAGAWKERLAARLDSARAEPGG